MNMKKWQVGIIAVLLVAGSVCAAAWRACSSVDNEPVSIDSTDELMVYYPSFSSVRLVCGSMPYDDSSVVLCVEAAYTHAILRSFSHANIDGDHVSDGVRYAGAACTDNTGRFVYYNHQWKFVNDTTNAELDSAALDSCGMGFGQSMVIYNKNIVKPVRNVKQVTHFRCLCEKDDRLCIIDSKDTTTFGHFIYLLAAYGVNNAIYLDMGRGWNHSWYRRADGTLVELFPKKHPFCTNWVAFVKE